jgi:glycosyltransferase involved in cell wall biosynthesis
VLNALWHRAEWPPVEWLAGPADVVHAAHPLIIPARHAAQVTTIHDLFFLTDASATSAEIRRDYPGLARSHARRAHAVITSSEYGRQEVATRLGVDESRIHVVAPGAPRWRTLGQAPNRPPGGYVLFVGTLEPRKNLGVLLDAWTHVTAALPLGPKLVIAGRITPHAHEWLNRIGTSPLAGRVEHRGYVPEEEREALYAGASALVLPSIDEGFGLPVLEAMSAGVPVIASRRGAIPEVSGDAAALIEPDDTCGLADAICRVLSDGVHAADLATRGLIRARDFNWDRSAAVLAAAYQDAIVRRQSESRR